MLQMTLLAHNSMNTSDMNVIATASDYAVDNLNPHFYQRIDLLYNNQL